MKAFALVQDDGDWAHWSSPKYIFLILMLSVKMGEDCCDIILFSCSIGGELSLASSTAGEIEGDDIIAKFGEISCDAYCL